MKKVIRTGIAALSMALALAGVSGCGSDKEKQAEKSKTEEKKAEEPEETKVKEKEEPKTEEPETEEPAAAEAEEPEENETPEAEETVERAMEYPSTPLPVYHYYGPEEWADYGDAATAFLLENTFGETSADLGACTPVILKVDDSDPADVLVWGVFWVDQFNLYNTTLYSAAGGSYDGLIHFDTTGGSPLLSDIETLEDGAGYTASVDRIFGKAGLAEDFAAVHDKLNEYRVQALSYYINHNGLFITQIQDYGWPAMPVPNAPETPEEAQTAVYVSNYGYSLRYDMREVCSFDSGEGDMFYAYNKEYVDYDVIVKITPRNDADIDAIVAEYNENRAEFQDFREYVRSDHVPFAGAEDCVNLMVPGPYKEGEMISVVYLIPRKDDILVVDASADYTEDYDKQMGIDAILEGLLQTMELE